MSHEPTTERDRRVLAGARITRRRLHRWTLAELLPSPNQPGLGRGRGTEALYPGGTTKRARALRRLLTEQHALDYARWGLWWEGFPVPESEVRTLLLKRLEWFENYRTVLRKVLDLNDGQERFSESELEARYQRMERLARGRLNDAILRRIRKRVGKENFLSVLLLFNEMATASLDPGRGLADLRLLERALGIPPQMQGKLPWLQAIAGLVDPGRLRPALAAATDADLSVAREELRFLAGHSSPLLDAVLATVGPAAAEIMRYLLRPPIPLGERLQVMLVWLSLRGRERVKRFYVLLQELPAQSAPQEALAAIAAEMQAMDVSGPADLFGAPAP